MCLEKDIEMKNQSSRRRFLKLTVGGIVGLTVGNKLLVKPAQAADLPHLSVDDAQAKALKYVNESIFSDKNCNNCMLIEGDASAEWRPCKIFPGKLVNGKGWCSAYAPKPA